MRFSDAQKVSRDAVTPIHPQDAEWANSLLKGNMQQNNYPHWKLSLSKEYPGQPTMPVACRQIALNAIIDAKVIWPNLVFGPLIDTGIVWPN